MPDSVVSLKNVKDGSVSAWSAEAEEDFDDADFEEDVEDWEDLDEDPDELTFGDDDEDWDDDLDELEEDLEVYIADDEEEDESW